MSSGIDAFRNANGTLVLHLRDGHSSIGLDADDEDCLRKLLDQKPISARPEWWEDFDFDPVTLADAEKLVHRARQNRGGYVNAQQLQMPKRKLR